MDKVTIIFKTITPMLMGGASKEPELRAPSIKGVLRFWYRVIYPNYTTDEENSIFGSAKKGFGQSKFFIRVSPQKVPQLSTVSNHQYLAYGIDDRECFPKGRQFTITLAFKNSLTNDEKTIIKRSLWAMLVFGGFGAKSRKGFGAVAVVSTTNMDGLPPFNWNNNGRTIHVETIKSFVQTIEKSTLELPEHSCWSNKTRCVLTPITTTAEESLTLVEDTIKKNRLSNPQGQFSSSLAKADNKAMRYFVVNNIPPKDVPTRAYFGLPHNLLFTKQEPQVHVEVNYKDEKDKDIRRASPLFISILQISRNQYCAIITFLYSRFIPMDKKITISAFTKDDNGNKMGEISHKVNSKDDYQLVIKVINNFAKQNGAENIL